MSLFPKTQKENEFSKLNKMLYGFPKTGKTTWASHIIDKEGRPPLFVATEDGHKALDVHSVRITKWEGFIKLVAYLKQNAAQIQKEHSCIVIDIVSDLDDMCTNYICETTAVRALADLDYGKGFALQKSEFKKYVSQLFNLMPLVFLAHSAEKEIMWNNEKIKVQCPQLSKACLEFINGKVDLIMWIAPANSTQTFPEIIMENSSTCIAGSRFPQLVGKYPFDPANIESCYDHMCNTFENNVISKPINSIPSNAIQGASNDQSTQPSN